MSVTRTKFGFDWDVVKVRRWYQVDRSNGTYRVLTVNDLHIYVSPTGRTRVFRGGKELKDAT